MKIAILSRDTSLYSTQRLVEAGKFRNHNIIVVDHMKCNIEIEKKKPRIFYKDRYLDDIEAIIPRIGSSVTFYGTAVVRQFEMMQVFTTISSDALMASRDKLRCLQMLSKAGVGLPKTIFTDYASNAEHTVESAGGAPLVLKLLEGTEGLGVVLAETKNAAHSILEAFNGLQARVIAQEFIKEAKGADVRTFVVDGKVVAAIKRQGREGDFRSNFKKSGSYNPIQLSEEEIETAITACAALGLRVASVDMLQSHKGPLVIEVNSSPGLEEIETATGADIAMDIIRYIETSCKKEPII